MRPGGRYGPWNLIGDKPLGQGGNSEVWRAEDMDGRQAAIKLLTRFDRYARFRDEVRFQQKLSTHKGVLPLLDFSLPDVPSKSNRPWLVTPLALPLREYVERSDHKLLTAVKAIHEVSLTLSAVHSQNAAHRDIKPENLFIDSGRALIGDFGLVTYPGKEPVTESGERLGPLFYVAPELIGNDEEPADCRPGDVYALAKTLWVLASGQRYPMQGNLSAYERKSQLSTYVNHDRAVLLDRLLDWATVVDPQRRPACTEFAAELEAWLSEKKTLPTTVAISEPERARLRRSTEVANRAKQERDLAREQGQRILTELHIKLKNMGEQIAENAGISSRSQGFVDGSKNASLPYFSGYNLDAQKQLMIPADDRCFEEHFLTERGNTIKVAGGAVLRFLSPTIAMLDGGLAVAMEGRDAEYLLRREFTFRLGSAQQEAAVSQFISDLQDHLPQLVKRLNELLEKEESKEPDPKPQSPSPL